ncbi:polysaccharide biosynthesis protein [Janibacter sp. YIM B02568]|nr:polysaccharide biosynthesis protein [Janibacter endophyticus]
MRYDFRLDLSFSAAVSTCMAIALVAHMVIGTLWGAYAAGHERGSYEEIIDIGMTVVLWAVPLGVISMLVPYDLGPRSLAFTAGALAMLGMFGARFVLRAARMRPGSSREPESRPTIVFGAGEGGRQLVRALVRDPSAGLTPVAFIDDDPRKRRMRISGVKVLGARADLARVAEDSDAKVLAVAVPSADSELLQDLRRRSDEADLEMLVLPSAGEMLGGAKGTDLRGLDVRDLLGRRPIELDHGAIADSIQGRTILVTGAGGSIGSELCRQIARFGPAKLYLLDRDESALHAAQISVTGRGLLDDDTIVLADIRDAERMREVMEQTKPDVVFHAAALKHLPLLEQYPMEAWKTNVVGTLNVLRAAQAVGVQTFVNVSTDKAANPSCVLGYSKRITERLTASFADHDEHTYVSVRFGNVLGSRGSVITAFTAQIEQGGPVTVTHPDVERYFMLIPEACQLVLQSAAIGRDGEVMVLEMGNPVKIDEVAKTLISMSGRKDVEIAYTGLRPGEKMSEELFTPGESIKGTGHELVSSVDVPRLEPRTVDETVHSSPEASVEWMCSAATSEADFVRSDSVAATTAREA